MMQTPSLLAGIVLCISSESNDIRFHAVGSCFHVPGAFENGRPGNDVRYASMMERLEVYSRKRGLSQHGLQYAD
jgi:hypothetical protein